MESNLNIISIWYCGGGEVLVCIMIRLLLVLVVQSEANDGFLIDRHHPHPPPHWPQLCCRFGGVGQVQNCSSGTFRRG